MILNENVKAEIVINPGTPVAAIQHVLSMCDQVLVMTVNPGFGGQSFIEETVAKNQGTSTIEREKWVSL